jgi:predicted ATPase
LAPELQEAVPLIAELLGISIGAKYPPMNLTPERHIEQVAGLARKQPVLAICEDAHWIDPTTLETDRACAAAADAVFDHPSARVRS